jgi:glutaredoxin 3
MQEVTIYTTPLCPFCVRAISLLKKKRASYKEIPAAFNRKNRTEMLARSHGRTTYPQIFIGETHVGGCDELYELERGGKLDALLAGA